VDAGFLDMLHDAADDDVSGGVGDGVDVELERIFEELVDQHRMFGRHVHRLRHVAIERADVVHDGHPASAEHVRRPDHDWKADRGRGVARFLPRRGGAAGRLRDLHARQQRGEPFSILREVDRIGRGAQNRHAGVLQRQRQLQRCLAPELHQTRHGSARRPLRFNDRHHVLERERLEVEAIRRVVVGRHCFPGCS
jgi:hypothetical protein